VSERIPTASFSTDAYRAAEGPDVLQSNNGALFETTPNDNDVRWGTQMRAFHLGSILVGANRITELNGERPAAKARADGIDHYIIQLNAGGAHDADIRGHTFEIGAGDIQVFDLARPVRCRTRFVDNINIIIPRHELETRMRLTTGLHGVILRGETGVGSLFADYIKSLTRRLPSLAATDAVLVSDASMNTISACLAPSVEAVERAQGALRVVLRSRAKQYIGNNLLDPRLSVDRICSSMHISRARLSSVRRRGWRHGIHSDATTAIVVP
jgi:hypothetical protein